MNKSNTYLMCDIDNYITTTIKIIPNITTS